MDIIRYSLNRAIEPSKPRGTSVRMTAPATPGAKRGDRGVKRSTPRTSRGYSNR